MELNMKNILIVLLFVLIGSLLCAVTYEDALDAVLSTGGIDIINGETCWVPKDIMSSEDEAVEYMIWTCMLFLYTWTDWDTSANASQSNQINSVTHVSGLWYEEEEDYNYMVSISKSEIMEEFNTKACANMSPEELYDAFLEFVLNYGEVSDF